MIVIDTSALVAILRVESECDVFLDLIERADRRLISSITLLETRIVMRGRHGPIGVQDLMELLDEMSPEIIPFDFEQAQIAADAFDRFGKGVNSRTKLNICDCASYALARRMNAPLLFKGEDFAQTDVERPVAP